MTRRNSDQRDGNGWYRIQAQSDGPALIHLYDEIGYFGVTAQDFIRELASIDGPVEVHVNSPGGDVGDGYAIYNSLASRPGVTTVVDGMADSAASVVVMAGEQRLMAPTSSMLIHDAWANFAGSAADMQSMAKRLETTSALISEVYAATAGGTPEFWRGLMTEQTTFSPKQALEAGLITGITSNGRRLAPASASASGSRPGALRNAAGDNSGWVQRDGKWVYDPDGDGDDDSAASTDTDHSHWSADGTQLKPVPPNPATGTGGKPMTPGNQDVAAPQGTAGRQAGTGPAPESSAAGASAATTERNTAMPQESDALTIEGRRARISDVSTRLSEIAAAYPASVLPGDVQDEWDTLVAERRDHQEALAAVEARAAVLAEDQSLADRGDRPRGSDGRPLNAGPQGIQDQPRAHRPGAPAVHIHGDIYDLAAIRQQARSLEELPGLYRQNALRAIDEHRFPGAKSRETAQENVARLLDTVSDDANGSLARRILATGSPAYTRAFGQALAKGNPGALSGRDAQVLALGESDSGSYAVPFELDPTVILTSDGVINPLRQISRVERIVGKEFDLVTSAGVTVSWASEFDEATNNAPTLAQPTIKPEKVHGFIPFSVEIEGDWTALQAEMMRLLADAKDVAEATNPNGFVLGDGTAPHASGIITTMAAGSQMGTATAGAFSVADVYAIKNAVPPRFRSRGSFLANSSTYDLVRQFGTGTMANVWTDLGGDRPPVLIGYQARELSAMSAPALTAGSGSKFLLFGDYQQFLIVDRVGMNIELVPHVFGSANRYPTGTRGYYAWWRTNSIILVPGAFRLLKVT